MSLLTFPRLALVLAVALVALAALVLAPLASGQAETIAFLGVDANVSGNTANSLGEVNVCSELQVGEERDIDVVVRGIPEVTRNDAGIGTFGGIEGFQFDVSYDERYVIITELDIIGQLIGLREDSNVIDAFSGDLPSESGMMTVAGIDFGADAEESGDGVLARLTVRGVGVGTSKLSLVGDILVDGLASFEYPIDAVQNGLLAVGVSCVEGATPPPPPVTPQPSPSPTSGGDETPEPDETDASGDGAGDGDGESPDASATPADGDVVGNGDGENEDDGSDWVVPVVIAVVIALVAVAGGVYALRRRGSTS